MFISKPKKSEHGTYVCTIGTSNSKTEYAVPLKTSYIVGTKDTSIFVKCHKNDYNAVYDLCETIVSIVKANCSAWFNTTMSAELVEDYFASPLIYDKTYGDILKLKVLLAEDEDLSELKTIFKRRCKINLVLSNIRFYKQKFVLEWIIKDVIVESEDEDRIEDHLDGDDDIDIPIDDVRDSYLAKLDHRIRSLKDLEELRVRLERATYKDIPKICEKIEQHESFL